MTQSPCISLASLALTLASILQVPAAAAAETYMLSGLFDGSEPELPLLSTDGACYTDNDPWAAKAVQEVSLQVSESGVYFIQDLAWFSWDYHGISVSQYLYPGAYGPGKAALQATGEYGNQYHLSAATDYTVVLQRRCASGESSWAVAVHGPGIVESDANVELPVLSKGALTPEDPTMTSDCGTLWGAWSWGEVRNAPYRQVGPVRVSRGGTYFHTTLGVRPFDEIYTCLSVYTAPVNPGQRFANRLALLGTWQNTVHLEADRDYWFVTHAGGESGWPRYGRYVQVLAPPAPPRLNPGMAGGWYDPERPGEGWFITVYDSIRQVFLAHFGFGTDGSDGEPTPSWSTAQGPFKGNHAELAVSRFEGGAFNAATPEPYQTPEGTVTLEFEDCTHGSIRYEPPEGYAGVSEVLYERRIVRVADDSERLCESLYAGPGKLGPL